MKYRQYQLADGDTQMTAWLRTPRRLHAGARVQVKKDVKPDRWWKVLSGGEMELDQPPAKEWHVGGL